jgi:hypothetical protein
MTRHGLRRDYRTQRGAAAPSSEPKLRGSRFVPPALDGEGRDHIVGGSGIPDAVVSPPDSVIDLADGTHITFATAGVSGPR